MEDVCSYTAKLAVRCYSQLLHNQTDYSSSHNKLQSFCSARVSAHKGKIFVQTIRDFVLNVCNSAAFKFGGWDHTGANNWSDIFTALHSDSMIKVFTCVCACVGRHSMVLKHSDQRGQSNNAFLPRGERHCHFLKASMCGEPVQLGTWQCGGQKKKQSKKALRCC